MIDWQRKLFERPMGYMAHVPVLQRADAHAVRAVQPRAPLDSFARLQNHLAANLLDLRGWKPSETDQTQMVIALSVTELRGDAEALTAAARAIFTRLGIAEDGVKIETLPPGNRLLPERIRCTLPKETFAEKSRAMVELRNQALVNKIGNDAGAAR